MNALQAYRALHAEYWRLDKANMPSKELSDWFSKQKANLVDTYGAEAIENAGETIDDEHYAEADARATRFEDSQR